MNALNSPMPPFPTNPHVGQIFMNWAWNGASWVCRGAGPVVTLRLFNTSGTYFPGPGLTFASVEVVGGGGGGGGALGTNISTGGWMGGGGGGSGGNYSRSYLAAALLRGGIPVTVGAGGLGATGMASGSPGGISTFGSLVIALGGLGGQGWALPTQPWQGFGGDRNRAAGGVGDLQTMGGAGLSGTTSIFEPTTSDLSTVTGGAGGTSFFGGNGRSVLIGPLSGNNGEPGANGSGGDGACAAEAASFTGGTGGGGMVVVTEWSFGNINLVEDCGCDDAGRPVNVRARVQVTDDARHDWSPSFEYDFGN